MRSGSLPSIWPAYVRALLSRRPALLPPGRSVPPREVRAEGVAVGAARLAAYRRVCGFPADGTLPITFPHVLAMPLHLALLTGDAFPLRLLGLVHLRNHVESARPLGEGERLDLRCSVSGPRETERGQELDLHTAALAGGERVWSEVSVLLARRPVARGARAASPGAEDAPVGVETASFPVPAAAGRAYARVSGDFNPIHLAALTARAFGFERAIAHGMWSLARIAATLGPAAPAGPVALDAAFKRPILLPARVALQCWPAAGGVAFALRGERKGTPHVTGSLVPA